jgi:hypothetical protein
VIEVVLESGEVVVLWQLANKISILVIVLSRRFPLCLFLLVDFLTSGFFLFSFLVLVFCLLYTFLYSCIEGCALYRSLNFSVS